MKIPSLQDWPQYTAGKCDGCVATCCYLAIRVTVDDLVRLDLLTNEERALSHVRVLKKLPYALSCYRATDKTFELRKAKGGACIYLKDSRCSVYDKRPKVCASFPIAGGVKKGYCPFIAKP